MAARLQGIIWETSLPTTRKIVLLKLADNADDDGSNAWPSIRGIARRCGLSRSTVKTILREFRENGIITATGLVKGGRGKTTNYTVKPRRALQLFPPALEDGEKGSTDEQGAGEPLKENENLDKGPTVDPFSPEGVSSQTKGSTDDLKGSEALTPNPSLETSTEPPRARDGEPGPPAPAAPHSGAGSGDPVDGEGETSLAARYRQVLDELDGQVDANVHGMLRDAILHELTPTRAVIAVASPFFQNWLQTRADQALRRRLEVDEVAFEVHEYARIRYAQAKARRKTERQAQEGRRRR